MSKHTRIVDDLVAAGHIWEEEGELLAVAYDGTICNLWPADDPEGLEKALRDGYAAELRERVR